MLQAVKSKIITFLRPITEREETENKTTFSSGKRRYQETPSDCLMHSVKRRKSEQNQSSSPFRFLENVGNLWKYMTTSEVDKSDKIMSTRQVIREDYLSDGGLTGRNGHRGERKFLRATKQRNYSRKPLSQISNATILDLTNIDDSDNETTDIHPVIDLTRTVNSDSTAKNAGNVTTRRNAIGFLARQKSSGFLEENVRLDERKRYRELLAQFTTVDLPEYSRSIIPARRISHSTQETSSKNSNNCSSKFMSSIQRVPSIDLTKEKVGVQPRRRFYHELLQQSKSCSSILEYSQLENLSMSQPGFSRSITNAKNDSNNSILLETDWILKWRKTLDPVQLERDRQIGEQERKKEILKNKQQEAFEKLEGESTTNEFVELSEDMLSIVKQALSNGNPNEVLVQGFNAEIKRTDIASLRDATWLNDEVVNFYFNLLKERSQNNNELLKVHIFNTFFYPKIVKVGHTGVKRWTRKVDIFAFDLILIPVHLGMHWCLAVVDFKNKQIAYYDSLKGNNSQCIIALRKYLQDESMDKKKTNFDLSDWNEIMPKNIPEQMNGCDCGMFMCKYAEYRSRNAEFSFTQNNMPYFRKRMIYEILSKKLL